MNWNEKELDLKWINICPICKGMQLKIIHKVRTINPNSDLEVEILKCLSCLHWFVNPIPKQRCLSLLYNKASEYVITKAWKKTEFNIPELYIIKNELKSLNNKKYLEIGIGSGILFNYFRQIGYDCYGVEPGDWAKGIPNIIQDINSLNENKYDVIVLVDVLEHIEDPVSLVKKISGVINTSGNFYASFPNNQSLRALMFKGRWRMIRPFGHLHFFSKKSLLVLFESSAFRIRRTIKTDLVKFKLKNLFKPPYFIGRLPWSLMQFLGQSFWGDQWIVHLIKE